MDMFDAMRIYTTVVDTGSFTSAADALQIHKPVVTKAIQHLEKTLGARLLHRTTRKMSMTAEGEAFYERCTEILSAVTDTLAAFSTTRESPRGKLRLDMQVTLAKSLIIPALQDFQRQYPLIELVIGVGDRSVDMINEGIDCVVRLGEHKDSNLIVKKIGAIPMLTCASPGYLTEHGHPKTLDELMLHKAVNSFSGPDRKLMDWHFQVDGKDRIVRLKSGILVNETEAFLASGLADFGIMQGLQLTLQPYIERGELIAVLPEFPAQPKTLSVLYPHRHYLAPKVRVFIDWLTELVRQKGLG